MRILSGRLSVCQTRALWQNGRKVSPDFYTCEISFSLVFWEEEWLVGPTPSTWNFWSTGPCWSEITDFEPIIARSACASAYDLGKTVHLTLIGSPYTRFPTSLRWSSYVAPKFPKGAQKRQNGRFPSKSHFAWRKSATKFLWWKLSLSGKVVGAFIGLTIHAKIIGGASPFTWNVGSNWSRCSKIADFRSVFLRSTSAVRTREKSSINTNRKSPTRFPTSLRWSSCVASKSLKGGGLKNAKCPKFEQ